LPREFKEQIVEIKMELADEADPAAGGTIQRPQGFRG
jgi:hypothetical protein